MKINAVIEAKIIEDLDEYRIKYVLSLEGFSFLDPGIFKTKEEALNLLTRQGFE
jgi:hypothetical protein